MSPYSTFLSIVKNGTVIARNIWIRVNIKTDLDSVNRFEEMTQLASRQKKDKSLRFPLLSMKYYYYQNFPPFVSVSKFRKSIWTNRFHARINKQQKAVIYWRRESMRCTSQVPTYSLKALSSRLLSEGKSKRKQHDLSNIRVRYQSLGRPRQPELVGQTKRQKRASQREKIHKESPWNLQVLICSYMK